MSPIVALVSTMVSDDLTASLAETVRAARVAQGLSASALAERSGVSRAMIAKVERAEAQPTAALLGRLSAALGLTLSELSRGPSRTIAGSCGRPISRPGPTPRPATGGGRFAAVSGGPLELVEVELPAGAEIAYPADGYAFIHQQIWMLDGSCASARATASTTWRPATASSSAPPSPRTFIARAAAAATSSRSRAGDECPARAAVGERYPKLDYRRGG